MLGGDTLSPRMSTADQANRPPEVQTGQVVGGKWRVGAMIGRGGMGAVYEGTNTAIGKKVALKFIDAEFANNVDIASRFQREAEAASLVESAHIVHIFDSGTTDTGQPYIVMELLRGEDLRARINRLGRLPKEEVVHIAAQTLRGLYRAHEAGIVHRDLKPDNIFLVDRDDDPLFAKIVDFGISKVTRRPGDPAGASGTLTRQGVVLGTPFYMSPEQAQAFADLDLRTDLWSLGAIIFECLGGKPPFAGDAYEQIIIAICTTDAPDIRNFDATVPPPLAHFVGRALSRDRAARFQTAKEMLDALKATGVAPVRTIDAASSGQRAPMSQAQRSAEADAASGQSAPSGRTRVSWTAAGVKAPATDDAELDEARGARAQSVRRRALVVVGAIVTGAAFLLTFGLLRPKRSELTPSTATSPPASASAHSNTERSGSPASDTTDSKGTAIGTAVSDMTAGAASADSRAANSSAPPGNKANVTPPGAVTKTRRGSTPVTSPPAPVPPPAATGSARTGVAGGLQIKTSYP
jgi:serine/threonine-protein kinase